jgi:hypothetical protein
VLFRRLAAFHGRIRPDAAQAVAGTTEVERFQVLDQLSLLVDKSLIVAENSRGRTRYRLLETVRERRNGIPALEGELNDREFHFAETSGALACGRPGTYRASSDAAGRSLASVESR